MIRAGRQVNPDLGTLGLRDRKNTGLASSRTFAPPGRMRFQICLICKQPGLRDYNLCAFCSDQLRTLRAPVMRTLDGYVTRGLFAWPPGGKQAFVDLTYSLKGREDPQTWSEMAIWMAECFPGDRREALVVPVPGSGRNHAAGLARALAEVLGGEYRDLFQPVKKRSQKDLSRKDRRQVIFELKREVLCTDYNTVLIVDDVITTGATAEAAFRALGRPRNCEVWCLMDRRPCDA